MPHLDEGVESLAIHLQELLLNVQHVNLRPGNHYSDKDTICSAQPLKRERETVFILHWTLPLLVFSIKSLLIPEQA